MDKNQGLLCLGSHGFLVVFAPVIFVDDRAYRMVYEGEFLKLNIFDLIFSRLDTLFWLLEYVVIRKITLIFLSFILLKSVCNNYPRGDRILCIIVIVFVVVFRCKKPVVIALGGIGFVMYFCRKFCFYFRRN